MKKSAYFLILILLCLNFVALAGNYQKIIVLAGSDKGITKASLGQAAYQNVLRQLKDKTSTIVKPINTAPL